MEDNRLNEETNVLININLRQINQQTIFNGIYKNIN
jgi:hypothetical protein